MTQGVPDNAKKPPEQKKARSCDHDFPALLHRITELEKQTKGIPNLEQIVNQVKEDLVQQLARQERLVADLESLHLRVNSLETHNKALANIILPTLVLAS